jgi:hypothetical protein
MVDGVLQDFMEVHALVREHVPHVNNLGPVVGCLGLEQSGFTTLATASMATSGAVLKEQLEYLLELIKMPDISLQAWSTLDDLLGAEVGEPIENGIGPVALRAVLHGGQPGPGDLARLAAE